MKKITLLAAAFAVSTFMNAQDVLSHSVDNSFMETGSVACAAGGGTPQATSSANIFYRSYTPSDFGYTGDFNVEGSDFFISFSDVGGTNPTHDYTVRFYIADAAFPGGNLTELASVDLQATVEDDAMKIEARLDDVLTLSASQEIIIGLDIPASPEAPNNLDMRIGINAAGQNAPSYLYAEGCGITTPTPAADVGDFPNNNIILDLVGTGTLAVDSAIAAQVSLYPNPVNNVLNITVPSSIQIEGAMMYDILGKGTQVEVSANNTINTSSIASGVYLLTINTNEGNITKKVVKQ
ncbi:T9SS type A sorting domain-containing protein [Mesonia ostreae]|uniref:T9SS type A sorting domain-containing protein n=1 Tax=Mesonia ostreae TaxID=861110 RepID=A0ABU2KL40_9FLAO|nr:T9SS type A sorting domain-containing protein [Mesonia ostreae]MDT0295426.1 T9SS type A sorting domain-containing protein [Mesonia ostreae]